MYLARAIGHELMKICIPCGENGSDGMEFSSKDEMSLQISEPLFDRLVRTMYVYSRLNLTLVRSPRRYLLEYQPRNPTNA